MTIRESGKLVVQFPISSATSTSSNWLQGAGLSGGYLLTAHDNHSVRLSDHLKRGRTCEVEVAFSRELPPRSSLWLSWISP